MPHYRCAVPGCSNKNYNSSGDCARLSYFSVPHEKEEYEIWCKRLDIDIPFEEKKDTMRICQLHFEDSELLQICVRLKPNAVPNWRSYISSEERGEEKAANVKKEKDKASIQTKTQLARYMEKNKNEAEESKEKKIKELTQQLKDLKHIHRRKVEALNAKLKALEKNVEKLQGQLLKKESEELTAEIIDKKFRRNKTIAALVKKKLIKKKKPIKSKFVTKEEILATAAKALAVKLKPKEEDKIVTADATSTKTTDVNNQIVKVPKLEVVPFAKNAGRVVNLGMANSQIDEIPTTVDVVSDSKSQTETDDSSNSHSGNETLEITKVEVDVSDSEDDIMSDDNMEES